MDPDRPISISRSGERPITRWRREPEPIEKPRSSARPSSGASRSYGKMERPTSRRGIKNDITEFGISRPPTSGKSPASRPPSANVMTARVPTAAPRLHTMSMTNLSRMNSGLPRNFPSPNSMMMDRPLTQQGLAGLRPSSSRGDPKAIRQIQDSKYYEQVLRLKIQEVKHEIINLNQYIERHNMEKVDDSPQYEQRSAELTAQMTELQAQLAEYNLFLDKLTSGSDKSAIETQVKQFKEINNREEMRKISPPSSPSEKSNVEEKISPVKKEAYNLYVKIFEAEQKRNKISDDSLTSAEEKEQLLKKIKEDGLNAAAVEKRKADSEKDLESNDSENTKQEEIMDIFKTTMEKNKADELEKLRNLEEQIIEHLEVISNNIDATLDSNILDSDEIELLKTLMNQNFENHNDKNLEELREDNKKTAQFLSKLESLELKIISELSKPKKQLETQTIDNSETDEILNKDTNEQFIEPEKRTLRLEAIKKDYSKLKADIEKNEIYRSISILEDKLERVSFDNEPLKEMLEKQRKQNDPSSLIERLSFLISHYNTVLINEMKTVY